MPRVFLFFGASGPFRSNLLSLPPAECLFQPLSLPRHLFRCRAALSLHLLNCGSNHFFTSRLLILVSPYPPFQSHSLLFPPPSLNQWQTHSTLLFLSLSVIFLSPPLPESASDGPFLSNPVHIDPNGSSMQGESCEDRCYSVLNATNALDVGSETRLPGRVLSIAAPSCQQQPNGLSIWDL